MGLLIDRFSYRWVWSILCKILVRFIYICVGVRIHVCIFIYTHIYVYTCIYIYLLVFMEILDVKKFFKKGLPKTFIFLSDH